jgi:hypothetical protein
MRFRRIVCAVVAASTICAAFDLAATNSASAAPSPALVFSISNLNPEQQATIVISACFANLPRGGVVEIDRGAGSGVVFSAIARTAPATPKGCVRWGINAGIQGSHPYRAQVISGTRVIVRTSSKLVHTFGPVTFCAYLNAADSNNCYPDSTQVSSRIFSYAAAIGVDQNYPNFSNLYQFQTTTCRSASLTFTGTNYYIVSENPVPNSGVDSWLQAVTQTMDAQTASAAAGQIGTLNLTLDGRTWALNASTNGMILINGTMDCYTGSGI